MGAEPSMAHQLGGSSLELLQSDLAPPPSSGCGSAPSNTIHRRPLAPASPNAGPAPQSTSTAPWLRQQPNFRPLAPNPGPVKYSLASQSFIPWTPPPDLPGRKRPHENAEIDTPSSAKKPLLQNDIPHFLLEDALKISTPKQQSIQQAFAFSRSVAPATREQPKKPQTLPTNTPKPSQYAAPVVQEIERQDERTNRESERTGYRGKNEHTGAPCQAPSQQTAITHGVVKDHGISKPREKETRSVVPQQISRIHDNAKDRNSSQPHGKEATSVVRPHQISLGPTKRLFLIPQNPEDKVLEVMLEEPPPPPKTKLISRTGHCGGQYVPLTHAEKASALERTHQFLVQQTLIKSRDESHKISVKGKELWIPLGDDVVDETGLQFTMERTLAAAYEHSKNSTAEHLSGRNATSPMGLDDDDETISSGSLEDVQNWVSGPASKPAASRQTSHVEKASQPATAPPAAVPAVQSHERPRVQGYARPSKRFPPNAGQPRPPRALATSRTPSIISTPPKPPGPDDATPSTVAHLRRLEPSAPSKPPAVVPNVEGQARPKVAGHNGVAKIVHLSSPSAPPSMAPSSHGYARPNDAIHSSVGQSRRVNPVPSSARPLRALQPRGYAPPCPAMQTGAGQLGPVNHPTPPASLPVKLYTTEQYHTQAATPKNTAPPGRVHPVASSAPPAPPVVAPHTHGHARPSVAIPPNAVQPRNTMPMAPSTPLSLPSGSTLSWPSVHNLQAQAFESTFTTLAKRLTESTLVPHNVPAQAPMSKATTIEKGSVESTHLPRNLYAQYSVDNGRDNTGLDPYQDGSSSALTRMGSSPHSSGGSSFAIHDDSGYDEGDSEIKSSPPAIVKARPPSRSAANAARSRFSSQFGQLVRFTN